MTSEPDGAYKCHFKAEKHISPYKPAYMDTLGLINSKNEKGIKSEVHSRQNSVCVGWRKLWGRKCSGLFAASIVIITPITSHREISWTNQG